MKLRERALVVLSPSLVALALASSALAARTDAPIAKPSAAKPPTADTGAAAGVTYEAAALAGSLNPRGQQTEYYFQYGQTDAYGAQTGIAEAGAGTAAVKVSVPIAGLAPLTIYHYRLVAVNGSGTTLGRDRSFKTGKVPLSLAIFASPNPVVYGGAVTIDGTLSGTGAGSREVVLEGEPFPFTTFADVGNTELTSPTGGFSFVVLGAGLSTQYRVSTTTSPAVLSPVVSEGVSVIVHVQHSAVKHRKHRVRVSGTVTPAESGVHIGVMLLKKGKQRLAGGAVLHADGTNRSSFSTTIYRRSSLYRVYVLITSGSQSSTYSAPFQIR